MNRIIIFSITALFFFTTSDVFSQRQDSISHHLNVSVHGGFSGLNYDLIDNAGFKSSSKGGLGYGLELRYDYFFSSHWGVGLGAGLSYTGSRSLLKGGLDNAYELGRYIDDDETSGNPRDFDLRLRFSNLEEQQDVYFLDIPLVLNYRTRFDDRQWGLYASAGGRLQLPVVSKYKLRSGANSLLNVSGYYVEEGQRFDMGAPDNPPVPQHGFGTTDLTDSTFERKEDIRLKYGVVGTAEFGFLFALSDKTDLSIGAYLNYSFTDIKKSSDGLFLSPDRYPVSGSPVGAGIGYNGLLNSGHVKDVKPFSVGLKVGVRFGR
jgi:hypothetical protein